MFAAELLGSPVERTVVVEDAISGVAAGSDGGFGLVVGIDRGAGRQVLLDNGADIVAEDLAELVPSMTTGAAHTPPAAGDRLDRRRFPVDPWRLTEVAYDARDLGRTETMFAVGNGYLGMRGNVEEGRHAHAHGTFINGFHETWTIRHAEEAFGFARVGQTIVNVPGRQDHQDLRRRRAAAADGRRPARATAAPSTSPTACCAGSSSGERPPASGSASRRSGWSRSGSGISRS